MRRSLLVVGLCIGLALAIQFPPKLPELTESIVHLSPDNCADVYLVAQFIVLFYAYHL